MLIMPKIPDLTAALAPTDNFKLRKNNLATEVDAAIIFGDGA